LQAAEPPATALVPETSARVSTSSISFNPRLSRTLGGLLTHLGAGTLHKWIVQSLRQLSLTVLPRTRVNHRHRERPRAGGAELSGTIDDLCRSICRCRTAKIADVP